MIAETSNIELASWDRQRTEKQLFEFIARRTAEVFNETE